MEHSIVLSLLRKSQLMSFIDSWRTTGASPAVSEEITFSAVHFEEDCMLLGDIVSLYLYKASFHCSSCLTCVHICVSILLGN